MSEKIEGIELQDCERQPCEVWTRVMGYFRPVKFFNIGKKGEFYQRRCFTEARAAEHLEREAAHQAK